MKIEDSFEVAAPLEETWKLLNDVPAVIPCMPGAVLVEERGENEWLARLATKVGPMAMTFDTDVTRTRADEASHSVELAAAAKELKGRGRANATIVSALSSADGGTRVAITTDLQMQGPLAQFGRGVLAEISAQMTREFAQNLAARLEPSANGSAGAPADGASAAASTPPPAKPIGGLRLFFVALLRWFAGLFRKSGKNG